jgi:hypothetical protein
VNVQDSFKWPQLIAFLVVLPPWIWLAVRTQHCLQVITMHSIPFAKRTIQLTKILALIVGAGGVFGAANDMGMPWFVAILPPATVIFFAFRERVVGVIPPKPIQNESGYQPSWNEYRLLRSAYKRSWTWFGGAFLTLILMGAFADKLPNAVQIGLFALCLGAVFGSIAVISLKQLKLSRWPCPRCGCAFGGFWGTLWLPKNCVYCGLPKEVNVSSQANS